MRVAVVTTRRYHLLDLARELDAQGHRVQFIGCVTRAEAERHGLPAHCLCSVRRRVWPHLWLERRGPAWLRWHLEPRIAAAVDRAAARRLARCDVLIGLSGVSVRVVHKAQWRFGATVFLERGGRHILSQKDLLEKIPTMRRPAIPHEEIKRELWGYNHADVVVVASRHARASFLERGVPSERLFRIPYGVDLERFAPTMRRASPQQTVMFVGRWSLTNGCDLLTLAARGQPWRVIHVGPQGDAPWPGGRQFERRGIVEDWEMASVFREADILVRPSRGEGMAMVQAQALACGVPVVCSDKSGGEDLRDFLDDPSWVTVVPAGSLEALREGIAVGLERARSQIGRRSILERQRERLSWRAYGERYAEEIVRRVPEPAEKVSDVVPGVVPVEDPAR
ncbi:MAG: glycosyltransferase [Verrucomicrobia bacterium]|nr:MAG: glycosyltransferase [Verrucomicrobiota bacterium]